MNRSPLLATVLCTVPCVLACAPFANAAPPENDRAFAYRMYREHFASGRYDEALDFGRQVVQLTERQFGAGRPQLVAPLVDLGNAQIHLKKYYQAERSFQQAIDIAERHAGLFSRALIDPLLGLGKTYAADDRPLDAIDTFRRGIDISRRADGLFNEQQLELMDAMMDCYVALDLQQDLENAQQYALRMGESTYGPQDLRLLPTLERSASWYEKARRYFSARKLYIRAIDLIRKRSSDTDLAMVTPLRGIARSFQEEYRYGIDGFDADPNPRAPDPLRSTSYVSSLYGRKMDAAGERSLQQALRIVRQHPEIPAQQLADVLIELGDWYQMGNMPRQARQSYKEAWIVLDAPGAPGTDVLETPVPLAYSGVAGKVINKQPGTSEEYNVYFMEAVFTVTQEGRVANIELRETDAPRDLQPSILGNVKKTLYRPRLQEGEPVDTPYVRHKQRLYYSKK